MLPFLEPKHATSIIRMKKGKMSEVANEVSPGQSHDMDGFHLMADDILAALEQKSVIDLAKALKAFCQLAFDKFEMEPHDEYQEKVDKFGPNQATEGHEDEV